MASLQLTLLSQLPDFNSNVCDGVSTCFDAIKTADILWIAARTGANAVQLVSHNTTTSHCTVNTITLPGSVAIVQLGKHAVPQQGYSISNLAVLVIVTNDCRIWAFGVKSAVSGAAGNCTNLNAVEGQEIHVPCSLQGLVGCQLAALVAWEYLCCSWDKQSMQLLQALKTQLAVPLDLSHLSASLSTPFFVHSLTSWAVSEELRAMDATAAAYIGIFPDNAALQSRRTTTEQLQCSSRQLIQLNTGIDCSAGYPLGYLVLGMPSGEMKAFPIGIPENADQRQGLHMGNPLQQHPSLSVAALQSRDSIQFITLSSPGDSSSKEGRAEHTRSSCLMTLHAASGRLAPEGSLVNKTKVLYSSKATSTLIAADNNIPSGSGKPGGKYQSMEKHSADGLFASVLRCSGLITCLRPVSGASQQVVYCTAGGLRILPCPTDLSIPEGSSAIPLRAIAVPLNDGLHINALAVLSPDETRDPTTVASAEARRIVLLGMDGTLWSASFPDSTQLDIWSKSAATMEQLQQRLQSLLGDIADLTGKEAEMEGTLQQLDRQLEAVSNSMYTVAGLHYPVAIKGIYCELHNVSQYMQSSNALEQGQMLMQVSLHNRSTVAVAEGWTVVVAWCGGPSEDAEELSQVAYSAPLGVVAPNSSWQRTVQAPTPELGFIRVAVLLSRPGGAEGAPPCTLLLLSTELDALHFLPAATVSGGPFSQVGNNANVQGLEGAAFKVTLGLPKALYGLSPSPALALQDLMKVGLNSDPASPQPSVEDGLNVHNAFSPLASKDSAPGQGQRQQQHATASLQGNLWFKGSMVTAAVGASKGSSSRSTSGLLDAPASHSLMQLRASSSSAVAGLHVHGALLRRIADLSAARNGSGGRLTDLSTSPGLKVDGDVLLPLSLSGSYSAAPVDIAALEASIMELRQLKAEAVALQQRTHSDVDSLSKRELLDMAVRIRQAVGNVPVLL